MSVRITDPGLLERQRVPDEAFIDHMVEVIGSLPPREWDQEAFERGLRYPWHRPKRSFLLREDEAVLLDDLGAEERREVLARHADRAGGRAPLLAFGSNAAPRYLAGKLAHQPKPEDREVLVLAGELHGFDVVAQAAVAVYGAMPATLAVSPGTRVDAAVLFVTAAQLTTLTWSELPYRLGRLRGVPFTVEDGFEGLQLDSPLAYVSRWGTFLPRGEPAPLAAVSARERVWPAWNQEDLIARAGEIVLGPEHPGADAFMRALHQDPRAMAARALPLLRGHSAPFESPDWVPIADDGTV